MSFKRRISTGGPRGRHTRPDAEAPLPAAIEVAILAIWRWGQSGIELLATRRPQGVHLAGTWEFPGGKIRPGESPRQAGVREVAEEVGLHPTELWPLITVEHAYPDRKVRLHALLATVDHEATAQNLQVADHRWVPLRELGRLTWPEANGPILAAIVEHLNSVHDGAGPPDLTT